MIYRPEKRNHTLVVGADEKPTIWIIILTQNESLQKKEIEMIDIQMR